ncbi:hypothetical protein H4R33_000185 [Dimargaris cristalligena]|nr:hypothetical protein H4R33_000185 [Dimargaris cristalligena]
MPIDQSILIQNALARLKQQQEQYPTGVPEGISDLFGHRLGANDALASEGQRPILPPAPPEVVKVYHFRLPHQANHHHHQPSGEYAGKDGATDHLSESMDVETTSPSQFNVSVTAPSEVSTGNSLPLNMVTEQSQLLFTTALSASVSDPSFWTPMAELLQLPSVQVQALLARYTHHPMLADEQVYADLLRRATDDDSISYHNLVAWYGWLGWRPPLGSKEVSAEETTEPSAVVVVVDHPPSRVLIQSWTYAVTKRPRAFIEGWMVGVLAAAQWVRLPVMAGDIVSKLIRELVNGTATSTFQLESTANHCFHSILPPLHAFLAGRAPVEWSEAFMGVLQGLLATKVGLDEGLILRLTDILELGMLHPDQMASKKFAHLLLTTVKGYPALLHPHTPRMLTIAGRSKTFLRKTIETTLRKLESG